MSASPDKTGQFRWTRERARAAWLLAEDAKADADIAAEVGVARSTLSAWKTQPGFTARIAEHVAELEAAVGRYRIAKRRERIRLLDQQQTRLLALQDARAETYADKVPGGATGLMIPQVKIGGGGPDGPTVVTEWVRDDVSPELRALQKQAAQELGQWSEKSTMEHTGGIRREIVVVGADDGVVGDVSDAAAFGGIEAEIARLADDTDEDGA